MELAGVRFSCDLSLASLILRSVCASTLTTAMNRIVVQEASESFQVEHTESLNMKPELIIKAMQTMISKKDEGAEQRIARDEQIPRRMQVLRDNIDVKEWEINQAAGRDIRSHEEVQHISISNRLHDFMQQHGAELASELMGYNEQIPAVKQSAMQHSVDYLREALSVWLAAGEKINYSVQDSDILAAIGFRPDAASRDDNREKFTPAQNLIYTRRRAELAAR